MANRREVDQGPATKESVLKTSAPAPASHQVANPSPSWLALALSPPNGDSQPESGVLAKIESDPSAGQPLEPETLQVMQKRLASPLQGARLHTDSGASHFANSLGARAFTRGQHIYFSRGAYQPRTTPGRQLLAHELTHTAQQAVQPGRGWGSMVVGHPGDPFEKEAIAVGGAVAAGGRVSAPPTARVSARTLQAADAATTPAATETSAQKIARIIADEDSRAILELATDPTAADLNTTTAAQRAGMVRILTNLTWTWKKEESATIWLIRWAGEQKQVISALDAIGYRQKVLDSVDDDALHQELVLILNEADQGGMSSATQDPAIAKALASRDSDDVITITDFSHASHSS